MKDPVMRIQSGPYLDPDFGVMPAPLDQMTNSLVSLASMILQNRQIKEHGAIEVSFSDIALAAKTEPDQLIVRMDMKNRKMIFMTVEEARKRGTPASEEELQAYYENGIAASTQTVN